MRFVTAKTFPTAAAAFFLVSACVSKEPRNAEDSAAVARQQVDSASSATSHDIVPRGETAAAVTPPAPPADTATHAGEWQVTPKGIGSLTAGMSLDEANIALHNKLDVPSNPGECSIVKVKGDPKGISLMVENGTVTRVDVTSGSVATVEGAKIGDSEAAVKALYPGQVAVQPHKYTSGHYLVVTPKSGGDYRIIFETDGSKVTRFRSGKLPSVANVEGCS
ncbi:MAG TPA: hypothetical protein VKO87_01950 [Gemmatimonadaceae bacterium]|nr:hypothetical protein [Gemmatimonadaceae bacterium]